MSSQVEEDRARADSKAGKTGTLVLWRTQHFLLPIEDLARAAGLHISLLEKLVERNRARAGYTFPAAVPRVRH